MAGSFVTFHGKGHEFRPYLGFAKNAKEVSGPSLKIQDAYCLLVLEYQDLRRNTASMGCTVHCLPILLIELFCR